MNKLLLMVAAGTFSVSSLFAQKTSENTASGKGHIYVANWADCMEKGAYAGGVSGKTDVVSYSKVDTLTIKMVGNQGEYTRGATFLPLIHKEDVVYDPAYDCSGALLSGIDLSTLPAQQKAVLLTVSASAPALLRVTVGTDGDAGFPCSNNNFAEADVNEFEIGTTKTTIKVLLTEDDYLASTCAPGGKIALTNVTNIGINANVATGDFEGEIYIHEFRIGDAIDITNTLEKIDNQVAVYPNPAKESFKVDLSAFNGKSVALRLMNANGAIVLEETAVDNHVINAAELEKGIYMLQLVSDNKVANKKVVIE